MEKTIVLGTGKLGLCLALQLEFGGYDVLGIDVVPDYVQALNEKSFRSPEPEVDKYLDRAANIRFATDLKDADLEGVSVIFVTVATPSTAEGGYDHSQVERVLAQLRGFGPQESRRELVIVCTTMPGYIDSIAPGMQDLNYYVSYNPEFIAQGSVMYDLVRPDQLLIGEADPTAGDRIVAAYRRILRNEPVFCRMSPLSAELCKLATNCFLTTKISFANAIGDLALKVGAEPDKILAAVGADSRIGGKYLKYGFGFGGPCFPRDNRALGLFAGQQDYPLLISQATDQVNAAHLDFQVQQWLAAHPEGEPIVFDYVSYKPGTPQITESQQLALAVALARTGRQVIIRDSRAVVEQVQALYGDLFTYQPSEVLEGQA